MSGIADVYGDLRRMVVAQLGYDIEKLTPAQEVKVGVVAGLRLELDRPQTEQLRGAAIDPKQLLVVGEALEQALKPAEHAANAGPRAGGARENLLALFEGIERAHEAELAATMEREERVMSDEAFAAVELAAAPKEQAAEAAAKAAADKDAADKAAADADNAARLANAAQIQREMTRPRDEPWRGYVSPTGIVVPMTRRSWEPPRGGW